MNGSAVVLPPEAVAALERGQTIEAIKIVRLATGLGLKESKDAVDAHLAANPALRERLSAEGAESGRRALLVMAGLVLLALALFLFLQRR